MQRERLSPMKESMVLMSAIARTAGHMLHDPQCSRKTVPISSQITNAYTVFSKMTCSVVTVITHVTRDGTTCSSSRILHWIPPRLRCSSLVCEHDSPFDGAGSIRFDNPSSLLALA